MADFAAWLEIFEQVKSRLFMTLLDDHLCELGVNIIKEFLEIPEIHNDIIVKSRPALSYVLSKLYVIQIMCICKLEIVKLKLICYCCSITCTNNRVNLRTRL